MPTHNVNLTRKHSEFIQRVIAQGDYASASEVVRDALRLLEQRKEEDRVRLQRLRDAVQTGIDQLERGEYTVLADDAAIDGFMDRLAKPRHRPRISGLFLL